MKKTDSEKIAQRLNELEREIETLIYEYDQFFLGFQRVEPVARRKKIERMIRDLMDTYIANATLKFRLQNLRQRYATYREKWDRFLRQMEEGTFVRDVFRAKQRGLLSEVEARRKLSQDARSRMKLAEESANLSSSQDPYKSLYSEYVRIKGGRTNMDYERWKKKLEAEKQKLLAKTKARDIEFKIVEVNGKPKIKAIPKK